MSEFNLWYTYFDTLFLKKNPDPAEDFLTLVQKYNSGWARDTKLNELVDCFQSLEQFILRQENWGESICTIEELNKVQYELSSILNLLRVEKVYIRSFWEMPRRIQASLTHLYSIFQLFVRSCIPYETMTIFECKAAKKLCVKFQNLQILVNSLLKNINPISIYFSNPYFGEENTLIANFFQNLVKFMKNLPKEKKFKMFHVPVLLNYVAVNNPIEIYKTKIKPRKKYQLLQLKEPYYTPTKRRKTLENAKNSLSFYQLTFLDRSLLNRVMIKSCPKTFKIPKELHCRKKSQSQISRFEFPTWIRRHSITLRKESLRKASIESNKKYAKGKSNTVNFYQSPEKLRSKTKQGRSDKKMKTQSNSNFQTPPSPTKMQRNSTRKSMGHKFSLSRVHISLEQQERYEIIQSPLISQLTKKYSYSDSLANSHLNLQSLVIKNEGERINEEEVRKQMKKLLTMEKPVQNFEKLGMVDEEDYYLLPWEYLEYVEKKYTQD